jgi:sugar phosphate isomerase/epimerase
LHDFGLVASGPNADWEQVVFWTERAFPRLAELGVEVVGVYGLACPLPEGFSRTLAMDQAVKFAHLLADHAAKYRITIALEPMADPKTLWPRYVDGLAFAKEVNRPQIKVMADLAYFLKLNQPFEDIAKAPEMCMHAHIAGEKGQPGIGNRWDVHVKFCKMLKEVGYTRGVSAACPWVSSVPGTAMDFAAETKKTLEYMRKLREAVYHG